MRPSLRRCVPNPWARRSGFTFTSNRKRMLHRWFCRVREKASEVIAVKKSLLFLVKKHLLLSFFYRLAMKNQQKNGCIFTQAMD